MFSRVLGVWVIMTVSTQAFVGMPVESLTEMIQHKNALRNKPKSEEETIEAIQAYILKEMFFDPVLNDSDPISQILNEDEDEDEFGVSSGMDMYKGLLAGEISQKFKGRDLLGLKKRYLNRDRVIMP